MKVTKVLSMTLAGALLAGCGISGNLRGNPGYAAFDSPGWSDTDREIALSLGPLPLKLVRAIVGDEDPEVAAILGGLEAVRVYVYRVDGDVDRVQMRMGRTTERLGRQGWKPVVAVRESGGLVRVMLRSDHRDRIQGMVVIAQDDTEVVLVNLIGDLRPESFNDYMDGLQIDAPRVAVESG